MNGRRGDYLLLYYLAMIRRRRARTTFASPEVGASRQPRSGFRDVAGDRVALRAARFGRFSTAWSGTGGAGNVGRTFADESRQSLVNFSLRVPRVRYPCSRGGGTTGSPRQRTIAIFVASFDEEAAFGNVERDNGRSSR